MKSTALIEGNVYYRITPIIIAFIVLFQCNRIFAQSEYDMASHVNYRAATISNDVLKLLATYFSESNEYADYHINAVGSDDDVSKLILTNKEGKPLISIEQSADSTNTVYAKDASGKTLTTFAFSQDALTVRVFDKYGKLIDIANFGNDNENNKINQQIEQEPADFVTTSQATSFIWYYLLSALAKGLSDAKEGYADYYTFGYMFGDDADEIITKLAPIGASTKIDDETIANRNIYFSAYSSGDSESGVTIQHGDLTSSYSTVPVIRGNSPVSISLFYNSNSAFPKSYISTVVKLQNREVPENTDIAICNAFSRIVTALEYDYGHCTNDVAPQIIQRCTNPDDDSEIGYHENIIPGSSEPATYIHPDVIRGILPYEGTEAAGTAKYFNVCQEAGISIASRAELRDPDKMNWNIAIPVHVPNNSYTDVNADGATIHFDPNPAVISAHQVYIWDGKAKKTDGTIDYVPTGSYPYEVVFTEAYDIPQQSNDVTIQFKIPQDEQADPPRAIIRNERNSYLGAGWTIGGVQRIYDTDPDDGIILLSNGDGGIQKFQKSSVYADTYLGPEGSFSFIQKKGNDFFRRLKDGTEIVYKRNINQYQIARIDSIADRNGNRTVYQYTTDQKLQCILLPTNSCTRGEQQHSCNVSSCVNPSGTSFNDSQEQFYFDYSQPDMITITDPAARKTVLKLGTDCIEQPPSGTPKALCKIYNPDGTYTSYKYDSYLRLVQKDDPRVGPIDLTTYSYNPCQQINAVERILFADGSSRVFRRSTQGQGETTRYEDNVNYLLQCQNLGGSETNPAQMVDPANLHTFVVENPGTEFEMARVYKTNPLGSITGFTNSIGATTKVEYNEHNQPELVTAPNGAMSEMTYDTYGNTISVKAPGRGEVVTLYEHTFNNPIYTTDGRGNATTFEYDPITGNLVRQTAPDGQQSTFTYTENYETPINGQAKISTAFANTPTPQTTTSQYMTTTANILSTTPPGGLPTSTSKYDGVVSARSNPLSTANTDYSLLRVGLSSEVVESALNRSTKSTFDVLNNRVLSTIAPNNTKTCFGYDEVGNQRWVYGPKAVALFGNVCPNTPYSNATEMQYDAMNRMTLMKKSANVESNRESKTVVYNQLGQIESSDYYESQPSNPASTNKFEVKYEYDKAGRLTKSYTTNPSNPSETVYKYDSNGMGWIEQVSNDYVTLSYQYFPSGDVSWTSVAINSQKPFNPYAPPSTSFSFTYDNDGNRMSLDESGIAWSSGNPNPAPELVDTIYTYDKMGRMSTLLENGILASFHYDGKGRTSQMRRSYNGYDHLTVYEYYDKPATAPDGSTIPGGGLLKGIYSFNGDVNPVTINGISGYYEYGNLINSFVYEYDAAGRRDAMDTRDYRADYTYDSIDQLTSTVYSGRKDDPDAKDGSTITSTQLPSEYYFYDNNGNRTAYSEHMPNNTPDYTYDQYNDRLQNDGVHKYYFDHNGNMVKKELLSDTRDYTEFHYNHQNKLETVKVFENNNLVHNYEYRYDPLGRRIAQAVTAPDSVSDQYYQKYIYDGDHVRIDLMRKYIDGNYSWQDAFTARYSNGPGLDRALSIFFDNEIYYYHTEALGSITALSSSTNGSIMSKYIYDSYGNVVDDCNISSVLTFYNRYRFIGREWDYNARLYYLRDRNYDPIIARFQQEDKEFFNNLYYYSNNSPIIFYDPFGNAPLSSDAFNGFDLMILRGFTRISQFDATTILRLSATYAGQAIPGWVKDHVAAAAGNTAINVAFNPRWGKNRTDLNHAAQLFSDICGGDYKCYHGHLSNEGLMDFKNIKWDRFHVITRRGGPDSDGPITGELKGVHGLSVAHEDYILYWIQNSGQWALNRQERFGMSAAELKTFIELLPSFF
jgi:RHS repeat-associated protein